MYGAILYTAKDKIFFSKSENLTSPSISDELQDYVALSNNATLGLGLFSKSTIFFGN